MLNSCVMLHNTGPAPGIMVWGGIGYRSLTSLVRIAGTLNSQRYISEVLEPVVLPYLQGLATAIFQQDNARPHVTRIVRRVFVTHQIELLPWPARSPDLSPIENMWSLVAQRFTQITPPVATPDQLWPRVEAAWSAVPQEHIQSLFESMPRRVAAGLGLNPGEDMDVCKCIVPLRHEGTLNIQAPSPLVWLVEEEERWEAPGCHQVFLPLNWGGAEQNSTFTCMMIKAKANDRCKSSCP
ncbi:transposable element Tcb1 transposase [Trichonephila clavipes]|nr:transposable element Tcb1 transposase [Trichonephila clavipes]